MDISSLLSNDADTVSTPSSTDAESEGRGRRYTYEEVEALAAQHRRDGEKALGDQTSSEGRMGQEEPDSPSKLWSHPAGSEEIDDPEMVAPGADVLNQRLDSLPQDIYQPSPHQPLVIPTMPQTQSNSHRSKQTDEISGDDLNSPMREVDNPSLEVEAVAEVKLSPVQGQSSLLPSPHPQAPSPVQDTTPLVPPLSPRPMNPSTAAIKTEKKEDGTVSTMRDEPVIMKTSEVIPVKKEEMVPEVVKDNLSTREEITFVKKEGPIPEKEGQSFGRVGKRARSPSEIKERRKRLVPKKGAPSILMFPDIDPTPGPMRWGRARTHTAPQVHMDEVGLTVWNDRGYRISKCTHELQAPGAWYYEVKMESFGPAGDGNARVGWTQISANLQGPCGVDVYGYSLRWTTGTTFHRSIGTPLSDGLGPNDVLGLLFLLPPLTAEEEEDLLDRKWAYGTRYLPFQYACPKSSLLSEQVGWSKERVETEEPMTRMRGSQIVYFVNGQLLGMAYSDIFLGNYYAAISCYNGARAKANFGPEFDGRMPEQWEGAKVQPLCNLGTSPEDGIVETEKGQGMEEEPTSSPTHPAPTNASTLL
ncbi:hypothetical protein BJ684DRAFT_15816 [Piptocephalis cylindrospora]|uniref:SPRY domain-containing protein n=1 Tax=Piptocephalis cylindrospora TaxID=1907219 RepID=A0A4P9Y4C2_9FUNG|nr:hypothetical protein BJ684DRAFT_15816 [Piptocephalis cylindrospora]|eukprot:RKP13816.1 hypothetical protein BJ684DRAFT_15816 [Piptocephalis cylindrospora]